MRLAGEAHETVGIGDPADHSVVESRRNIRDEAKAGLARIGSRAL